MERQADIRAYAKINLSLGVGPLRSDGYHPVETVLASVDLHDTVHLRIQDRGVAVEVDDPAIPVDGSNIACRAAEAYLRAAAITAGVYIRIRKGIPVAAGLAGGSADAAAVLMGLQRLFGSPLDRVALECIAADLGSDVPFCLTGGLALATGRGTEVKPLPPIPEGPAFVLVNPGIPVSTKEVYRRFDGMEPGRWPDTGGLISALGDGNWEEAAQRMANMLEPAASILCPEIPAIRDNLLRQGAVAARMSGSGPTVYGFFRDREAAGAAAERLRDAYPFVRAVCPGACGIRIG